MSADPDTRPDGKPRTMPTPREIKALRAVADGSSITQAAMKTGMARGSVADALSKLYRRLGIDREITYFRDARREAIEIGRTQGWWEDR